MQIKYDFYFYPNIGMTTDTSRDHYHEEMRWTNYLKLSTYLLNRSNFIFVSQVWLIKEIM